MEKRIVDCGLVREDPVDGSERVMVEMFVGGGRRGMWEVGVKREVEEMDGVVGEDARSTREMREMVEL